MHTTTGRTYKLQIYRHWDRTHYLLYTRWVSSYLATAEAKTGESSEPRWLLTTNMQVFCGCAVPLSDACFESSTTRGGGGLPQECLVPAEVPSTWNETLDVENDARYDSQHIGELCIEASWNKKYVISNQCQVCTFKRNINWRCS